MRTTKARITTLERRYLDRVDKMSETQFFAEMRRQFAPMGRRVFRQEFTQSIGRRRPEITPERLAWLADQAERVIFDQTRILQ